MAIAALVRDVGVIVGIPLLLTIGLKLFDLETKSYEAQIKAVEARNAVLKETQYDRALAVIKAQKELFENEHIVLRTEITNLRTEVDNLRSQVARAEGVITYFAGGNDAAMEYPYLSEQSRKERECALTPDRAVYPAVGHFVYEWYKGDCRQPDGAPIGPRKLIVSWDFKMVSVKSASFRNALLPAI
jgi:hypothetical protein